VHSKGCQSFYCAVLFLFTCSDWREIYPLLHGRDKVHLILDWLFLAYIAMMRVLIHGLCVLCKNSVIWAGTVVP